MKYQTRWSVNRGSSKCCEMLKNVFVKVDDVDIKFSNTEQTPGIVFRMSLVIEHVLRFHILLYHVFIFVVLPIHVYYELIRTLSSCSYRKTF